MEESHAPPIQMRLVHVTVPVADIDRAIDFYIGRLGFVLEQDQRIDEEHRFVELSPPGSSCSIAMHTGYVQSQPGSLKGTQLNVDDIRAAHRAFAGSGVAVSEVEEYPWGRFFSFADPDGNDWNVHEPA